MCIIAMCITHSNYCATSNPLFHKVGVLKLEHV